METRKITVINTQTQTKVTIMSAATTLAELKRDLDANNISYTDMAFYEGLTHCELKSDDAILPHDVERKLKTGETIITNELAFMLTNANKKIKSGITRHEAYTFIKHHNLTQLIHEIFGRNYTNVSTEDLIGAIKEFTDSMKSEPCREPEVEAKVYTTTEPATTAMCALVNTLVVRGVITASDAIEIFSLLNCNNEEPKKDAPIESSYSDDELADMFAGVE